MDVVVGERHSSVVLIGEVLTLDVLHHLWALIGGVGTSGECTAEASSLLVVGEVGVRQRLVVRSVAAQQTGVQLRLTAVHQAGGALEEGHQRRQLLLIALGHQHQTLEVTFRLTLQGTH